MKTAKKLMGNKYVIAVLLVLVLGVGVAMYQSLETKTVITQPSDTATNYSPQLPVKETANQPQPPETSEKKSLSIRVKNPNHYKQARKEGISPRQKQIENYHTNPDSFTSADFGDQTFHFLVYEESRGPGFSLSLPKQQNFPQNSNAGIAVFNQDKLVWENSTFFRSPRVSLQDLTGDNIMEIVSISYGSGNSYSCGLYVYKWQESDNSFALITPAGKISLCYTKGVNGEMGELKDIDNDGVYEIIDFTVEPVDLGEGKRSYKKVKVIYKFNGKEYYPWDKEELDQSDNFDDLYYN